MRRAGPFTPLTALARRQSLEAVLAGGRDDIPVFAYGSLVWDAEYLKFDCAPALLPGYRRAFCVWTAHARGTPAMPGLGLGLYPDAAAQCGGMVIRLTASAHRGVLEKLWEREMWTGVYDPGWVTIETNEGATTALTFIVNQKHPQFSGDLTPVYRTERALRDLPGAADEFEQLGSLVRREAARMSGSVPSG